MITENDFINRSDESWDEMSVSSEKDIEEFLKEEVRCDYVVTADMKKVWSKELQLLSLFSDICTKYNLRWQMAAGSLLGTVRHKGFIPWDDDIDVIMPREDYDTFVRVAPDTLQNPFFLQTSYSDPGRNIGYAQLRNSSTAAIDLRYVDQNNTYNQGIFLDIFPVDYVSDDSKIREKQRKKIRLFDSIYRKRFDKDDKKLSGKIKHWMACLIYEAIGPKHFYTMRENIYRNVQKCSNVGMISFLFDEPRFVWSKEELEEIIYADFEYVKVPIPAKFDVVLTKTYGEWNKPVKGAAIHSGIHFDCDRSYSEVLKTVFGYTD